MLQAANEVLFLLPDDTPQGAVIEGAVQQPGHIRVTPFLRQSRTHADNSLPILIWLALEAHYGSSNSK